MKLRLDVACGEYSYPIIVTEEGLQAAEPHLSLTPGQQIMIVSNEKVASFYLQPLLQALQAYSCEVMLIPDGEEFKNQDTVNQVYAKLLEKKFNRDSLLIALGGGVIGDLTGFIASTYQRGIAFIQIPTTLLAQVDAAIGGKTGINRPEGKNLIGTFYQPQMVLIATETLKTLPDREFRAGLGEVIKYGLIEGGALWQQVQDWLDSEKPSLHSTEWTAILARCCALKAEIVSQDEKEQGIRAVLNLGHTFAHALEMVTQYRRWLHGEAVAIGLYCAALLSERLGFLSRKEVEMIQRVIQKAALPCFIPEELDPEQLIAAMRIDKKIKAGKLRFIVIRKPGDCYLEDGVSEQDLRHVLKEAVRGE